MVIYIYILDNPLNFTLKASVSNLSYIIILTSLERLEFGVLFSYI